MASRQEAAMCHAVRVTLSPAEAKAMRKLYGAMVPVYASLALVVIAALAFSAGPRPGEAVTVASNAAISAAVDRDKAPD
jgi:hypothetical protein